MTQRPFPLVIVCLLSIRGFSTLSSAGTGVPPRNPVIPVEDYDRLDETSTPTMTTSTGTVPWCDYHSCRENQTPCEDLAASHGCSCPGFSLPEDHPLSPSLRSVTWNGSAVVVHWCAPSSYVTSYFVTLSVASSEMCTSPIYAVHGSKAHACHCLHPEISGMRTTLEGNKTYSVK
uniref:Fibronectin type-III domain-containing protein n=1 Tax=Poecilia latipinna TaxID=48699 RepID=A0A3B3U013_9TELE